jgi:hypothetical protein
MDIVEEHPLNHRPEVEGIDREDSDRGEDITVDVEVKRSRGRGVDETLDWQWSRDASVSSLGMGGTCEVRVFRRSHHVCKSRLQLFDMV